MAAELGEALTGTYSIPGGTAQLFERGVVVTGAAGPIVVGFTFPMIGRPQIATETTTAGTATALRPEAVTFRREGHDINVLGPLVRAALAGRVAVVPTGAASAPQVLTVGPVEIVEPEKPTGVGGTVIPAVYGVSLTGPLRERQLYDVALAADTGWRTVAPHAVYYRRVWHDFGVVHVTDAHVARRIDRFRPTLYNLGRPGAAAGMYNWNDRFRGFIRYANYLHGIGALDVILATGDMYDYQFEYDDDGNGQGNALFLRDLLLGLAPGPDFPDVEELRVPIFMVPGNHDYRMHPYHLYFDVQFAGDDVYRLSNYAPYNLGSADALALWTGLYGGVEHGVPNVTIGSAARMVEIDPDLRPYRECLADRGSYVVRLGAHRIVMLDSAHDVGVLNDPADGLREWLGFVSEDEHTFAGGSPNCEGVSDTELTLAADALAGTADGGLFILGIHAPLFSMWHDELPYFLRQTQRPAQPGQDLGFVGRHNGSAVPQPVEKNLRERWPLWFPSGHDQHTPVFVKRGGTQDLLDYGVSRGRSEDLLRLLAGIGSRRPADVVLSGHTHRHNEFTLNTTGTGELAFYMDFYTANPATYYPTRYTTGWQAQGVNGLVPTSEVTYVEVDTEATGDATPWPMPYAAAHAKQLQVPPYPDPLSHSPDPRAWWAAHRPLVLQTGALGPMENNQVSFSGFRLLSVKGDVIDKVHSISINRLEANGYRLPLEDAARPDPPRGYRHSERSRRHHAPDAKSRPAAIWLPQLGVSNVTYRDTQDRLHELWKNDADSGTSNLTAPTAASDPSPYYDAVDRQLVVVYRDTDGKVYSLFWSTGPVGRNLLTPPGAAKAQGNPVGYFDAAGIHHVIYRSSDNHLHELYWAGAGAVGYRDLTKEASAPPATGDPSAYMDTRRGERVVIYRGTDNQVYSLYWTNGPVDYSKLSESVHAPKARGNPAGYYAAHDDVHQVVYRGIDDHLYELYWTGTGGVNPWNLTAIAGAPPADSDPAVYYSAGTNTKQVIYRSADGHLNDLSWVPGVTGPTHVDLTLFALAPPAVGPLAAFTIDGPNSQHVIYRGTDNQIHEITWTTSPSASPGRQDNWRWCNKCQGPFHGGNPTASKCPAGGTHTPPDQSGSVDYILPFSHSLT